jgi:DNA-directed RNA polymerase subunit RPC12/RpoP
MSARVDLTGKIYGDFECIEFLRHKNTHAVWRCKCTRCGDLTDQIASNLKAGFTIHCQTCNSKRSKLTETDKINICYEYVIECKPINKIMERYKISRGTIYKVLKKAGIEANRKTKY